jgi:hypothetical protein
MRCGRVQPRRPRARRGHDHGACTRRCRSDTGSASRTSAWCPILRARFADFRVRLVLARRGANAWGEEVRVKPRDGALVESLQNGSVHPTLVEEPRAA